VLHAGHPTLDGLVEITLQNFGDPFFVHRHMDRRVRELLLDDFGNLRKANRFHKDLIGLQEEATQGRLKHGVATEHERYSVGLCMAHGIDDGKPITSIRHVQVGEQHIEVFNRNKSERFVYVGGGYHVKPVAFQAFLERGEDVVVVVREQNSMLLHKNIYLSSKVWQVENH